MQRKELFVTLPYPPSINRAWRVNAKGGVYLAKVVREYRKEVWALLARAQRFGAAQLVMDIKLYPKDRRKRDLDNSIKCLWDALQHAQVFDDDSQVVRMTVERFEMRKGGMVEVKITECG